jgi:hypothetical protein
MDSAFEVRQSNIESVVSMQKLVNNFVHVCNFHHSIRVLEADFAKVKQKGLQVMVNLQ